MDEDAELAVDVPIRDPVAGDEGVPLSAERAFGYARLDCRRIAVRVCSTAEDPVAMVALLGAAARATKSTRRLIR